MGNILTARKLGRPAGGLLIWSKLDSKIRSKVRFSEVRYYITTTVPLPIY